MFFRANPNMTTMPCSCKDIYSRNASEELVHEDKCYDRYGRLGYTNILYGIKEESKAKSPEIFSKVYSQLKLHESKPTIFEFLEMSPWRACTTLRDPHKTCVVLAEKPDISVNPKSENQIQRRSVSTLEASVVSKKKGRPERSVRPYNDSRLNENFRKASTFVFPNSRNSKNSLEENYKFHHSKELWDYITDYTETVTLSRLQEHYRKQNHRHGNARAMTTQQQWVIHNALRSGGRDKDAREVPAMNSDLVSKDSSNTSHKKGRDETYYNVHFPSVDSCSFKVARCCVHAENRRERKSRIFRDDREYEPGTVDDKVQMLRERLSTASCERDENNRLHRKTSRVLQKSKKRKLEIVTQPSNPTSRNCGKPSTTTQPSRWQQYNRFGRRFPSPRVICKTPLVTKQAQFQEKVIAKKLATKTTPGQTPIDADEECRDLQKL